MAEFGVCSLEDDDFGGLFITQESHGNSERQNVSISEVFDEEQDMEVEGGECGVLVEGTNSGIGNVQPIYSDISDPEDDFVNLPYGRVNE